MFIRGRTWPALSGAVADKDSQAREGVTLVHLETRALSRLLASMVLIYGGRGGPHWGVGRKWGGGGRSGKREVVGVRRWGGGGGGRYEKKRGEKNGDKEEVTGEWRYHFYLILH